MGLSRIYLDSCIVIYIVEEHSPFSAIAESELESQGNAEFCLSDLTYLESIVKPLRTGNLAVSELFDLFFGQQTLLDMPREVFEGAAKLRAEFPSLKTPDALHLATAIHHNCDEFWTNDNRLNKVAPALVKNILTIKSNA